MTLLLKIGLTLVLAGAPMWWIARPFGSPFPRTIYMTDRIAAFGALLVVVGSILMTIFGIYRVWAFL